VMSDAPHRITQNELYDLVRDRNFWRVKQNCWRRDYNSGISSMTIWKEEGLAFPTITETGNKECTAPTTGRIQQHFAASSAHQTRTNEELR
jgi:hypothetical protein